MRADVVQPSVPAVPPPPAAAPGAANAAGNAAAAELQAAREAIEAATAQAGAPASAPRAGVVTNADGKVVITGRDGQTIVLDPKVLRKDQIDSYVEQALQPPGPPREEGPPASVVVLVGIIMFFISLMVLGGSLLNARNKRTARAGAGPEPMSPELAARLERIELAVDGVAVEVERIAEAQRFSAKLLHERIPEPLVAERLTAGEPAGAPARTARPD